MITFSNVSKRLGDFTLRSLSFELPDGYICGLVGRNGAGKTTLLHLLLGLYAPDEGELLIDGMDYQKEERRIREQMGVVLAEELFEGAISPEKNGRYYGSFYEQFDGKLYEEYLAMFRIAGRKRFGSLSKGEKLKCQFAFALAVKPRYLVLDEPTANFDPEFREQFWRLLQEFVSDGKKTVLLATHLTDDLDRMADYLIFLDQGSMVFAGDMEQFRDSYRIVSGEAYQLRLLHREDVLHVEDGAYGSKALVRNSRSIRKREELVKAPPTIEEFMYHYSKRGEIGRQV